MAIPNSGPPYVWTQLDASSKAALLTDLKDALVASGWTLKETLSARVVLTFTGLPGNGQTCTFDGQVYTYRTVLTQGNPREVLIGVDAAACAANLADAINANPATSGTAYSNSTTAHPTCTASANGGACTVSGTNGMTAAEGLNNATLDATTFRYGGYKIDSARNPAGLQHRLIIDDDGHATMIRLRVADCQEITVLENAFRLNTAASRLLEFYGCKHWVFTCLAGAAVEQGCNFHCGTLWPLPGCEPPRIASISDNGGEFQITTVTPHGLVTGDHVYISGATKDGGASPSVINGDHAVTVLDSLNYTLNGSTYTAENYDTDSGLSGSPLHTSRCIWAMGDDWSARGNFRITLGPLPSAGSSAGYTYCGFMYNQYAYSGLYSSTNRVAQFMLPKGDAANEPILNVDGTANMLEARMCWPISSQAGSVRCAGVLPNAFIVATPRTMDESKNGYLGFNWKNYTHNHGAHTHGSLWLISGEAV